MLNIAKYKRNPVVHYPEREWPDKEIEKAPIWCSVDLRDGNQALVEPMVVEEKIEFFNMLVKLGFKEIEIGFPAASQIEYDFLRQLVERRLIPDDVRVQVLVQCREHLIKRTFEAIQGIKKVVVHIYNSTSTLQRDVVFHKNMEEIKQIAIEGTELVKKYAKDYDGDLMLEYSPESFTGTELEYAMEVCTAVQDTWGEATPEKPIIFNLPSTVEMNTPNVYADQIEWMHKHFKNRESVILSVHPHNDRGTGVAATELALLAGADRVEGTLFGNGERTGNVDILNIAYNMFSQGIDPKLDIENVREIAEVYERCTKMTIDPRHPYAGKLVFTAFSGSHQDAINKGLQALHERNSQYWEVPYLPIDPSDIGRQYEPIVRINSQSGKGGVAFVMDTFYGFKLPKGMHKEFADVIQKISEQQGEVAPEQIMEEFRKNYLEQERADPLPQVPDHRYRVCRRRVCNPCQGYLYRSRHGENLRGRRQRPDRCSTARSGRSTRRPDQGTGLQRARSELRLQRTGSILHPLNGQGQRQGDLRCRRKLQHHPVFHPRYLQCREQTVLLIA